MAAGRLDFLTRMPIFPREYPHFHRPLGRPDPPRTIEVRRVVKFIVETYLKDFVASHGPADLDSVDGVRGVTLKDNPHLQF